MRSGNGFHVRTPYATTRMVGSERFPELGLDLKIDVIASVLLVADSTASLRLTPAMAGLQAMLFENVVVTDGMIAAMSNGPETRALVTSLRKQYLLAGIPYQIVRVAEEGYRMERLTQEVRFYRGRPVCAGPLACSHPRCLAWHAAQQQTAKKKRRKKKKR